MSWAGEIQIYGYNTQLYSNLSQVSGDTERLVSTLSCVFPGSGAAGRGGGRGGDAPGEGGDPGLGGHALLPPQTRVQTDPGNGNIELCILTEYCVALR